MRDRRWIFILIGIGLGLTLVLTYWLGTPGVAAFSPTASQVPASLPLSITFSRPMRSQSVIDRLTITPAHPGAWQWSGPTITFTPLTPWPPGITVTVSLAGGAQAAGLLPLPIPAAHRWSFFIERPRLLYLWPASGPADLYALDVVSGDVRRLTTTLYGLFDFSPTADGLSIYYSAYNATGGADIWLYSRLEQRSQILIVCPKALCHAPQLAPDQITLAYEQIPIARPGEFAYAQVWLVKLPAGLPRLAGAPTDQTLSPLWSSTGLLAYYNVTQLAYVLYDPQTGQSKLFPNQMGDPGAWLPDGSAYLAAELFYYPPDGPQPYATSHLLRFNWTDGALTDLTAQPDLEDAGPVFAPDGRSLAFTRRYVDPIRWTYGLQLWLLRLGPGGDLSSRALFDGAIPLTDSPFYHHHDLAWSPDSRQIAYVLSQQDQLTSPPELWLVTADGASPNPLQLVVDAYAPAWLP